MSNSLTVPPLPLDLVDRLISPGAMGIDEWDARVPQRDLPPGAKVTRFGPSPTGLIHIGGVYVAMISRSVALASGGSYFIRIEDTDQKRHVDDALEQFRRAFAAFDIESLEPQDAPWGPYRQSQRAEIYESFVRELLLRGRAYPCFCTPEELSAINEQQLAAKVPSGYRGTWARCRQRSSDDVRDLLDQGLPFTIRFRSPDGPPGRFSYVDAIRGRLEMIDNDNDIVVLKSSSNEVRLPTYHLAHVADDHLMRVNMVVRGDEWISSVPLHHQLFEAVDLPQVEYAHIAPLMKLDGKSRRKLSKRKDPEAGVDFYIGHGYPQAGVLHYLRSLANGRLAEMPWRNALAEPIRLEECNAAGPLVDLAKLGSMCREVVGDMSAEEIYGHLVTWATENDAETLSLLQDEQYACAVLDVERSGTDRVRKDMAAWSEFVSLYGFFFPSQFAVVTDPADERFNGLDPDLVRSIARTFADRYEPVPEADAWFEQVRETAATLGFAGSVKDFKASPEQYVGSIRDVATVLRVLITGAGRSPDLFEVCRVLGETEVVRRVSSVAG